MTLPPELVVQPDVFRRLATQCDTLIDRDKRLPDYVFRRKFAAYRAFEYTYLHRDIFGRLLGKLAAASGDTHVNYMTIDPDPVEHHQHHNFFGAVTFEASKVSENYAAIMSSSVASEAKRSPIIYTNIGVFWGSSGSWAIFSDRISWELGVIAVTDERWIPSDSGVRLLDPATLSSYMDSQYHWKKETAVAFTETFLANYSK